MFEDDFIKRAVRQLAAMVARTTASEVRAEADIERERADAALGRARDSLSKGETAKALREIEDAIARLTHLPGKTSLRIDAGSLRALAPVGGGDRLASLFSVRADVLRAMGDLSEAARSEELARRLS